MGFFDNAVNTGNTALFAQLVLCWQMPLHETDKTTHLKIRILKKNMLYKMRITLKSNGLFQK